jgi:hypothetical protein
VHLHQTYLKQDETVTSGKVESMELPLGDPILGILLHYNLETGAGEAAAACNEVLVEVLKNGRDVVTSAQMGELIAYFQMAHYRNFQVADLGASASCEFLIPIMFGRHWGDLEYFLKPESGRGWASLDLKVTQPTHTATTTATWDVILIRAMESAITPRGYFKISTKKAYTAAAAVEYVELDRAYRYGALLVSEMDGTSSDIATIVSEHKVNVGAGDYYPISIAGEDLELWNVLVADRDRAAVLPNILAENNFLALDFMHPWMGEEMLLNAPAFGRLRLELTGTAAGTIRVTGVELVQ